jgi:hypothetical protein
MARSHFGKGNLDAARQYLANLQAANPELKGRKSPGDMQPEQVVRQANAFYRQEQEGLAPNRQAARGHANTPEHKGGRVPQTPQEYRRARAGSQLPSQTTRHNFKNGNYAVDGVDDTNALKTVRSIENRGDGVLVIVVETEGKGFKTITMSTTDLRQRLEAGDSLEDIIAEELDNIYGDDADYAPVGGVRVMVSKGAA